MQVSRFSPRVLAACAALCLGLVAMPAMASTFNVCSDTDFSYTGTVTDPGGTAHTIIPYVSTPGTTTYSGRDASICVTNGSSGSYTYMETNWYSTAPGNPVGADNPNNRNSGFVQLVDYTNASATSAAGAWTVNGSFATFTLTMTGGVTTDANVNRLWAAPHTDGSAATTGGQFQNYNLDLTATFHASDVTEEAPGWWSTSAVPVSIGGGFSGTFLNSGDLAPGLYSFDFSFVDGGNWAGANGFFDPKVNSRYFAASTFAVPEPPTLILFGLAAFAIVLVARRRAAGKRARAVV